MSKKNTTVTLLAGMTIGASLVGGATAAGIIAEPTWQKIYVDGERVSMTAYNIAGSNYVKLRDIGKEVGFNVYWDNGVQIDSDADYTGEKPVQMPETTSATPAADDLSANMDIRLEIVRRINQVRRENGVFESLITGVNCVAESALDEFEAVKKHFRKTAATTTLCRHSLLTILWILKQHMKSV